MANHSGDDGFLVRLAYHQAAVLCGQRALGVSSGVGAFAQDKTDDGVAVAGAPGLALARALVSGISKFDGLLIT